MVVRKTVSWIAIGAFTAATAVLAFQPMPVPPAMIILDAGKPSPGQIPTGWQVKTNFGRPEILAGDPADGAAIHFKSNKASFGLEKSFDIDPSQMTYLTWRWKVSQLPAGGDFRHISTDDQAAQVMVAFADRRILTYIWDTTAPEGTMESGSSIPLVHIFVIVCHSGFSDLNRWVQETRNLSADYQKAFGKLAPHVHGLRLQINSQHTGTTAESYFGDMAFRNSKV